MLINELTEPLHIVAHSAQRRSGTCEEEKLCRGENGRGQPNSPENQARDPPAMPLDKMMSWKLVTGLQS